MTREAAPVVSSQVDASAAPMAPDTTLATPESQPEAALVLADEEVPTSVELVEVALGVQPVVRANPTYPPQAREDGLSGHVQLKFDVTTAGTVENITVVESSDAQFEQHAVQALAEWRYLPRIVAGKRVGSKGIHTIIRFVLEADRGPAPPPPTEQQLAVQRQWLAFYADLEIAMDRLAVDDLRGVELQLDEMQALHGADRAELWNVYGYLYTIQGNYGRAIDAYERSVAIYEPTSNPASGPWVPLANLYFARHQYDIALKTLLRPQRAANSGLDRQRRATAPRAPARARRHRRNALALPQPLVEAERLARDDAHAGETSVARAEHVVRLLRDDGRRHDERQRRPRAGQPGTADFLARGDRGRRSAAGVVLDSCSGR
jgi:TonB family protein